MKRRIMPIPILILSLCSCTLVIAGVCGFTYGYTVESVTPEMNTGTPVDTVPVDFWEIPPGIILLSFLVSISTMLKFPVELFFTIKFYICLGYRKVSQSTIFHNAIRNRIYTSIQHNPGIYFNALVRITGVKRGTLRYHLILLKLTGKISVMESSGNARYFENSGLFTKPEKTVLKYIMNKTDCRIFRLLIEKPEMSRTDLGKILGLSVSTVSWHMKRLSEDNLIQLQKAGKNVRYGINPEIRKYLEKYMTPEQAAFPPQSLEKSS